MYPCRIKVHQNQISIAKLTHKKCKGSRRLPSSLTFYIQRKTKIKPINFLKLEWFLVAVRFIKDVRYIINIKGTFEESSK